MTPDPDRTLILAFEHRTRVRPAMRHWLYERFPQAAVISIQRTPYIVARNAAMRDLLGAGEDWRWVLCVDNDVEPDADGRTDDWLATAGDLVACRCDLANRDESCWTHPDSFHNPLWFGRIAALRQIELPWFLFDYGPTGCELVACDCECLRQKAVAAGLLVRNGGWCAHTGQGSWDN